MMILPGWNSIDFTSQITHWLRVAVLVFLALSAIAQILVFVYGNRKDTLTAIAQGEADDRRNQEQKQAEERHNTESAELRRQLEETRRQQAPRRLTSEQQNQFIATLAPFPGQKVQIVCIVGDTEGQQLASDFVAIFQAAKW